MRSSIGVVLLSALLTALVSRAAEPWDGPPFSADPKALRAAAEKGGTITAPAEVLLDEVGYVFDAEGRRTLTWRRVYRILDAKAVTKDYSDAWAYWSPWYQERPELRARVIGPDGTVRELDPATISESPVSQIAQDLYSDTRVLVAPLPGFVTGAVVEVLSRTVDSSAPFRSGYGVRLEPSEFVPVRRFRVTLQTPRATPFRHALRGIDIPVQVREEGGNRLVSFDAGPLAALNHDEKNIPRGERGPTFGFSLASSWQAAATEYAQLVDQKLAQDDLRADARRVIGDAKTREEAVDRLLRWMKDVRYSGVELGNASYLPRSPRETLARGFGDCKDLATLMVGMLRAVGRKASVALLHVQRSDVDDDLPGLNRFDHAIVRVDGATPLWVDPTQPEHVAGTIPWSDQGRHALVADARTTKLELIPTLPSSQNLLKLDVDVRLADSGPGVVRQTTEAHGIFQTFLRYVMRGDSKPRREAAERAFKSRYDAETVTAYEEGACGPGEPCRSVIEGSASKKATTGDLEASAVVAAFMPFETISDELRHDDSRAGAQVRTLPFEAPPMVMEVRYHVVPPAGFKVRALGTPISQSLGPGSYTISVKALADGSVEEVIRLDTVKPLYTAEEVAAFRKATNALRLDSQQRIAFDSEVALAIKEGKTVEGVQRARALASAHPKVGAHQARLARALLEAGFGDEARDAARQGTLLAPTDPAAWRGLGFALEHDMLGRRLHPPFDRQGAIDAYRKAKSLAAERETVSELAWLLDHGTDGDRWSAGASLEAAGEEYAAFSELTRSHIGDPYQLASLFYLRKFDEVLVRAPEMSSHALRNQVWLAAMAIRSGAPAAMTQAERLTDSDDAKRALLGQTVPHLLRVRAYPQASALFQASAGQKADAQTRTALAVLPRLKTREQWGIPPGDPRLAVARLFEYTLQKKSNREVESSLFSSEVRAERAAQASKADHALALSLTGPMHALQIPPDVELDFTIAALDWVVAGDGKLGWRVRAKPQGGADRNLDFYVVNEGKEQKLLGVAPALGAVGVRALQLAKRGEAAAARQWITWTRESLSSLPNSGGDLWQSYLELSKPSEVASDTGLKTAATVLAIHGAADIPLEPIAEAQKRFGPDPITTSLTYALAGHFTARKEWQHVLDSLDQLSGSERTSARAFTGRSAALFRLGRAADLEALAKARLADLPDDALATASLVSACHLRGDIWGAKQIAQKRLGSGSANAQDYNTLAWDSLVLGEVDASAYDAAQRASELSKGRDASILNTHAALSAATGRTAEAKKLLLETLATRGDERLESDDWLVVGLMAEQYGLGSAARSAFDKTISTEDDPKPRANSAAAIAKSRLTKLAAPPRR